MNGIDIEFQRLERTGDVLLPISNNRITQGQNVDYSKVEAIVTSVCDDRLQGDSRAERIRQPDVGPGDTANSYDVCGGI